MVLELLVFKWEAYCFLMHVLSIFKPLWSNLTLFQDQIWLFYVSTTPKRDLKFNFGNIGTDSKALAKMFIELRLFQIKALCFLIHFLPFSVIWPYFRLKLDCCKFPKKLKGCKIKFWRHWYQSQPCNSNGFWDMAVWTQGGSTISSIFCLFGLKNSVGIDLTHFQSSRVISFWNMS